MATYGYDLQINPIFEKEQAVSLPTPLGMEMSTQLTESMKKAPFWSALRMGELAGARGDLDYAFMTEAPFLPPSLMEQMVTDVEETRAARKTLNQYEWENSDFNVKDNQGNSLLKFEDMATRKGTAESYSIEVNEDVASIMADRKRAELKSQEILTRSPQGLGRGILGLGASFVGQALDPINIAASFIPVVGPGFMATRLGVWGSRAVRGAIEGAVGNIIVEPLVWGAAAQEQSDYGFKDALLNAAFGAGIGAGGHMILGKLGDVLKIRSQADHIERIKATINAIDEGRPVDLDPLIRASDVEASVNIGRVDLDNYLTKNELKMTPEEIKIRQEFDATTKKYNLYDEEGNVELDPEMRKDLIIAKEMVGRKESIIKEYVDKANALESADENVELRKLIANRESSIRKIDEDIVKLRGKEKPDIEAIGRLEKQKNKLEADLEADKTKLKEVNDTLKELRSKAEELSARGLTPEETSTLKTELEKSIPLESVYTRQVDKFGVVRDNTGMEIFDPVARKEWIDQNVLPEMNARETNEWRANQLDSTKSELVKQAEEEIGNIRSEAIENIQAEQEGQFAEAFSEVDRLTFSDDVRKNLEIYNAEKEKLMAAIREDKTPVGRQLQRDFEDLDKAMKQLEKETRYKVDTLVNCLIGEV
jgi:hypothetical protein